VAQKKQKIRIIVIIFLFVIYFFVAARPIPRETVLAARWVSSLETGIPVSAAENILGQLFPFSLGSRFGYVDTSGNFAINYVKTGNIAQSENQWTLYDAQPQNIEIRNIAEEITVNITDPRGYPILLDNRIFILGSEQNALSEIDNSGNILWTYEFGAPLTNIDAAAGLVLTGSVDGIIEIIDSNGRRIFYFEPGGSRYAIILGCAISRCGSKIGIISGIDQQRFLLLERFGSAGDYRVVYHEFLDAGFRRDVHIMFLQQDQYLVFERPGGIVCYNIKSRQTIRIPLNGEIAAIEDSGEEGFFFLVTSGSSQQSELIGIRLPQGSWRRYARTGRDMRDTIFLRAPFKSNDIFLHRAGKMLIVGGGTTLISFNLEEK
jgi:hypothetical protein